MKIFTLLISLFYTLQSVADWKLIKEEKNIKIFTIEKESSIIPFKSEMTIPFRIEEVIAVLGDKVRRKSWIKELEYTRLIKINEYDLLEYNRFSLPFWFSDRSTVTSIKIKISKDKKTVTIHVSSIKNSHFSEKTSSVRATIHNGTITLIDKGDKTFISAITFIDPGGVIPHWLVNIITKNIAFKSLVDLKKRVALKLYTKKELGDYRQKINNYIN